MSYSNFFLLNKYFLKYDGPMCGDIFVINEEYIKYYFFRINICNDKCFIKILELREDIATKRKWHHFPLHLRYCHKFPFVICWLIYNGDDDDQKQWISDWEWIIVLSSLAIQSVSGVFTYPSQGSMFGRPDASATELVSGVTFAGSLLTCIGFQHVFHLKSILYMYKFWKIFF